MLIKNAARQDTVSTRTPPTNGPTMLVAEDAAAQTPIACPRSAPSKVAVMIASEPGTRSAAVAPCKTRKTISSSIVGASPQRAEQMPKPTRPVANIRRRP